MGQSPSSKNYTENYNDTILIQGNADLIDGEIVPRIFTTEITKISNPNEVIMTVRAPVGDLAINKYEACIGRGVCAIKSHFFIYFFLEKFKLNNEWKRYSQGSTIDAVSFKDIKSLKILIPSVKEQTEIAKFLTKVDRKISLLEDKLDLFKDFKKFCMEQLFAQKLRFKNEDGENFPDWKRIPLGKISTIKKGFTPSTNDSSNWDGDIPWLSIADMKKGKYLIKTTKQITTKGSKNKEIVKKGSLVMSFKLTIGRLAILNRDMYTNEAICNFQWKIPSISIEYMYYYLNSINIKKYGSQSAKGITLNNDSLETIPIKLPILIEQEKIACFLNNIENKEEKIATELKNFKEFKKGLLQQMLI